MTHLDHLQLVDALDAAAPHVESHLEACASCREQLEGLRASLARVRTDLVPEPSPLFWNHFSTRVNAGIDAEAGKRAWVEEGWMPHALAWSGVLALVLAVVSIIVAPKRSADPLAVAAGPTAAWAEPDLEHDEAWAVVRELATGFDYEQAQSAGIVPREGAVDRAALELSDAERAELARIIDAELKRIGP